MAKYRKKPVVIEAEQFQGGFECLNLKGVCADPKCYMGGPHLHTIHEDQKVLLTKGDWILPEPDGIHFYPCKPDIFAATYEPLEVLKKRPTIDELEEILKRDDLTV